MIRQLIAEATECDFKVTLPKRKSQKLVKRQCPFQRNQPLELCFWDFPLTGKQSLSDVQRDAEAINSNQKERITPLPQFCLKTITEDEQKSMALEVSPAATPYYYQRQTA